jgi:hypothetical protein
MRSVRACRGIPEQESSNPTMEIFVDFGFFELLIGVGLAAVAKVAYARKWVRILLLAVSFLAPILLLFLVHGRWVRWLAALCVATSLVNVALIATLTRRYDLRQLLARDPTKESRWSWISVFRSGDGRSRTAAARNTIRKA